MRYYGFGNYYLSSLQQGLQAHHVFAEMVVKYQDCLQHVVEWAKDHKTIVLLNGGNAADLEELEKFFADERNPYPFAAFNEDGQSLNGARTSVGIILPARIYDTAAEDRRNGGMYEYRGSTVRRHGRPTLTDWEEELVVRLNTYGLAK